MAYVYILESIRDGRYYIGSCLNMDERLKHHYDGFTHSTKRFGGLKLVLKQYYSDLKEARNIEFKLKKLKRKDYLKRIVEDGNIKMRA